MRFFQGVPIASLILSVACGGTAVETGDSGGGSGDQQGTGGQEGTGGGSGDVCASFDDAAPSNLDVLILNRRSTPIFLSSREFTCGDGPLFSLADQAGTPVPWFRDGCSSTCAGLRDQGFTACPTICLSSSVFEIAPGGAHFIAWDTLVLEQLVLPAECVTHGYGPEEDTECVQPRRIQPGTFTFGAQAGTQVDCSDSFSPDCGTCSDGSADGCVYSGGRVAGEELVAEVTVDLDASYGIVAEDQMQGDAAPSPGSGAIYGIEIVFTD